MKPDAPLDSSSYENMPPDFGPAELADVPGPRSGGLRALNTFQQMRDPIGYLNQHLMTYGPVFRLNTFSGWNVQLIGPEANELVLANRERVFSSALGWNPLLDQVFPRGLMMLDFDEHQRYRRALSHAFRQDAMRRHLELMNQGFQQGLLSWSADGAMRVYPAIKQLTLDLAATTMLGVSLGPQAVELSSAFADMVAASVAIVRHPWPGTAMSRGVRGRERLSAFIRQEIARRRGSEAPDILTELCNLKLEDGTLLDEQVIVDQINFLMLAAHDTVTSSFTAMVWFLCKYPEWQERLREEILSLRNSDGPLLSYDRLDQLPLTELAFKETLRLVPPVPGTPRRLLGPVEFKGVLLPRGTVVGISALLTHRMPEIWPEPEQFNPERFTTGAARSRHRFAWIPFGGGAHMCLGMHFANVQAKAFFFHLLASRRIILEDGYETSFQFFPIPRPKDGLRVRLEKLH